MTPHPNQPATQSEVVPSTPAAQWSDVVDAATDLDRLRTIARYDLNDPELRRELDEITAATAAEMNMPISLVTLVLDSSQLIAGGSGLGGWIAESGGTPLEWSFCAHAVASRQAYVVSDASEDPVQSQNPLTFMDGVTSYAGVPLVAPNGHILGAHCVIGVEPRHFSPSEIAHLRVAAREIVAALEAHARPEVDA